MSDKAGPMLLLATYLTAPLAGAAETTVQNDTLMAGGHRFNGGIFPSPGPLPADLLHRGRDDGDHLSGQRRSLLSGRPDQRFAGRLLHGWA